VESKRKTTTWTAPTHALMMYKNTVVMGDLLCERCIHLVQKMCYYLLVCLFLLFFTFQWESITNNRTLCHGAGPRATRWRAKASSARQAKRVPHPYASHNNVTIKGYQYLHVFCVYNSRMLTQRGAVSWRTHQTSTWRDRHHAIYSTWLKLASFLELIYAIFWTHILNILYASG